MDFTKMILKDIPADYSWDTSGIIRLGHKQDIAACLCGDCKGRCLIFCHGNAETAISEMFWFDELVKAGVTVICPDYRGYGLSDGILSENGCYEAAHVAYEFLEKEKGIPSEDIFVLGYSLGSAIAVELASTHLVGGLILQAPFLNGKELKRFWLEKRGISEEDFIEESFPTSSRLPKIHVPTLVIHGKADEIIPFSQGEAVFNLIAARKKKIVPVEKAGHCNFQVKLGREYISLLTDFMKTRNLLERFFCRMQRFFHGKR